MRWNMGWWWSGSQPAHKSGIKKKERNSNVHYQSSLTLLISIESDPIDIDTIDNPAKIILISENGYI